MDKFSKIKRNSKEEVKDTSIVLGNGVSVGDFQFDSISKWYSLPENLSLAYNNNYLTFNYIGITQKQSKKVKYQYKLEGIDENWSGLTNRTDAAYGNLPHGNYTFKVKAMNSEGYWSNEYNYSFTIRPPWWKTWWAYTSYLVFIVSAMIFIVWWNGKALRERAIELAKEVKKATLEIRNQKEIVEEKNKEITDSINYAKRIQHAKLPPKSDIYASLTQSFVLFKPKDIVSGDFYFFQKDEELIFIASADCTGHGVPGALMSMIGYDKLEAATSTSLEPSDILKQLNRGVKVALRQSGNDDSTRDGMDIAFCAIDIKKRVVKYAGANRPLWIIKNKGTEIEEIKATKRAIGGLTDSDQHFDSHELTFEEGDTIYLSTDGYADTFGGENDKKLTTKMFKQTLLGIQEKTMQEQELYLDNFIENWKHGLEQIDDILVIGIRM